jgi:hypothetical protein
MSLCHYFTRYLKWIEVWILASHRVVKLPQLPAEKRRRKLDWRGMDYVIAPLRKKSSSSTVRTKMAGRDSGRGGHGIAVWRWTEEGDRGVEVEGFVQWDPARGGEPSHITGPLGQLYGMTAMSRQRSGSSGQSSSGQSGRLPACRGVPACQPGDVFSSVCCPLGHHRP